MNQERQIKIYNAIRRSAAELCKNGDTFLRADLAAALKHEGLIDVDSIDVSKLVLEAYRYFNNDRNIKQAFVTNDRRNALIDDYKLNDLLDNDKPEDAMALAKKELDKTSSTLASLKDDIDKNMSMAVATAASGMMDTVTGTSGTKAVRAEASTLFDRYSKMVTTYHEGEDTVRCNIADFTALRTDIGTTYQEFAMQLIDIYGDNIKTVAPKLFDFSQVQFLDVDSMLKHTELEYNRISENCSALISEISDSFQASLKDSVAAYKYGGQGNKAVGLAMAGLGMLNHYMQASERTNQLRSDLSVFKTSIKHDSTLIKADLGRLLVIYKTLNDVVIPKADIYLRYAAKLLSSDIKAITDSLYNNEEVRPLEEKRRQLIAQLKTLDNEINDHLQNIDVYHSLISDIEASLDSKAASYNNAKASEPKKPFFLLNILTFGKANKDFYRNYTEWDAACKPLVREYEISQGDLKLDKEDLTSHQSELEARQQDRRAVKHELDEVNQQIRSKIKASKETQLKMLPHLRTAIAMLRLGRDIMETKLDKRLTGTVSIPDFKSTEKLPADIENNLTLFTSTLADNLHADRGTAEASEQALQQGISLLDSALRLKTQQLNGKIAGAAYDEEFNKIASDFREQIKNIDNRSAYVREVMRRANVAKSDDERKQAILMLSSLSGQSLSEQDFNDFIDGKKQITL